MIKEFVEVWDRDNAVVRSAFELNHPLDYATIVKRVVTMLHDALGADDAPDPSRVHEIDDGDYQGDLLYVIASGSYQPSDYWYVRVVYGSCSGSDTLKGIRNEDDGTPSKQQVDDYMRLALHILQGLRKME